jgi:hypothetical protein
MLKADITRAAVRVKAHWSSQGSIFQGTISSTCHAVETHLDVESDDDPARVAAVIHNARGGCYAEAAITQAVPLASTATLNGRRFDYQAYPSKVERR